MQSSRAETKLVCDTRLLGMQNKQISLTICSKQQPIFCSQRIMAQFVENWVIILSLPLLIQKNHCPVYLCFLTALFRWVLHCSVSHVYWPKPQCEIQNNCSPQLPWHSLAHCAVLFSSSRKSNWDRNLQKWIKSVFCSSSFLNVIV